MEKNEEEKCVYQVVLKLSDGSLIHGIPIGHEKKEDIERAYYRFLRKLDYDKFVYFRTENYGSDLYININQIVFSTVILYTEKA